MRLSELALEAGMSEDLFEKLFQARLKRLEHLEDALIEAMEFIERYSDVVDGLNGPEANEAMSLNIHLRQILDGKYD